MNVQRIIILYKRSAYSIYFKRTGSSLYKNAKIAAGEIERFRRMHDAHHACLSATESVVRSQGIRYLKVCRGQRVEIKDRDLVVTVGGDGTFLEGARGLVKQVILGVNSDPTWSVGRFCCATAETFAAVLSDFLKHKKNVLKYPRLELRAAGKRWNILNDVLFAHANPAAMSRYCLGVNGVREEQKSSGVWVSTAAGSSGAIKSAGGKVFSPTKEIIQYKPRELYVNKGKIYRLKGGVLTGDGLTITSMMREGRVFLDGSHVSLPVGFGESVRIALSRHPLNVVCGP